MTHLQLTSRNSAIVLIAALCLMAGCTDPTAHAQSSRDASSPSTISVWGNGQVVTTPDRAVVTIGVETSASEASAALSQNSEQILATIAALQKAGVSERDIQTQAVQLYTSYGSAYPSPTGAPPPTSTQPNGYTALNSVQVSVRDVAKLGALLDAAVATGSNRINGLRFEVSDATAALQQARQLAWQDAQNKAQQLAKLGGLQLGQVIEIQETNSLPVDVTVQTTASSPVPIVPGAQNVQINLNVTWQVR